MNFGLEQKPPIYFYRSLSILLASLALSLSLSPFSRYLQVSFSFTSLKEFYATQFERVDLYHTHSNRKIHHTTIMWITKIFIYVRSRSNNRKSKRKNRRNDKRNKQYLNPPIVNYFKWNGRTPKS